MLKIAVCDSAPLTIDEVERLVEWSLQRSSLPYIIEGFLTGETLLERLYEGNFFDIIYLDINLAGISGIDVGKVIREQLLDKKTLLIFITACEDKAKDMFECNAFRFLAKPINHEKFTEYLKSACSYMGIKETKHLRFKAVRGEEMSVPFDDIVYLESSGRIINLVTTCEEYQFYGKLGEIVHYFETEDFIRIHNSILVNFDFVSEMHYESVILYNGESKDISGPKRRSVRELYSIIRRRRNL